MRHCLVAAGSTTRRRRAFAFRINPAPYAQAKEERRHSGERGIDYEYHVTYPGTESSAGRAGSKTRAP